MKKKVIILFGFIPFLLLDKVKIYAKEASIGSSISYPFDPYAYTPQNGSFKELKEYSCESITIKEVHGWIWGSESENFATKVISIYNLGVIEAPYVHNIVGYLPKGSIYEFERKVINDVEYSTEVSLSTQKIYKASLGASGRIYAIKALADFETDTQIEISGSINTKITKSVESYARVTIPVSESGYYFDDLRATYNLYEIQEFDITNEKVFKEKKQSGLAWDYFYDVKRTATCTNISYVCEYITSCGRSLVKYNQTSDGLFTYAGPVSNDKILYI